MSAPKEDPLGSEGMLTAKANEHVASSKISPSKRDAFPELSCRRRPSWKSVSFRNIDEYFPVFSPESSKKSVDGEGSPNTSTLPFDFSEYSDFLDPERMATVLPKQSIDVTSPDHVFVYCRENSESTEKDLEKTVVSHCTLEVSDDELDGQNDREPQGNPPEPRAHTHVASSSSGTGGSRYSSCDSDHYTSCVDASSDPGRLYFPSAEVESNKKASSDSSNEFPRENENILPAQAELKMSSKLESAEPLPALLDKLTLSEEEHPKNNVFGTGSGSVMNRSNKEDTKQESIFKSDETEVLEENDRLLFTPSPFVTGRTRSRLSRCSMRTSRTPESMLISSSLFDDTLPTPFRTFRQTPRCQSSERCYDSPRTPSYTLDNSWRNKEGNSLSSDGQDTQSSTFKAPSVSHSQADTLILTKSVTDSVDDSQASNDTVILDKYQDNSLDAYEKNLAEIILAVRAQGKDPWEDKGFLTDDLTSADEAATKGNVNDDSAKELQDGLKNKDVWITEDCGSQSDSVSSSSTSSCFSPKRSREDSDLPYTPGTGCTPRYSMSRLSTSHRPQRLADLSFTPGGRPLIQDLDEPVEYLYTDTEQGHKLIETHVPPTTDTSLSSSMSTTGNEETVLYDWRSLQAEMKSDKNKENLHCEKVAPKKVNSNSEKNLLPEIRGITDKELRLRLVELGESPGPISGRTRPTYMRRLCRLLHESNSNRQQNKIPLDQPQTVNLGYSLELCRALQTLQLPDCQADEQALSQQFDQPDQNRKWREGIIKSSFNYLLLDPRVTKNLPFRSQSTSPHECFQSFIHAIFYVGKGKRSRPYSHLYEALEYYRGDKTSKKLCPKVQHILEVWGAGQGVVSLHCFQNVIPVEAYTREACMVEAIGLKMLTNQKRGDFYGVVSNWEMRRKRELGIHLLYRAMQIFLAEGERQLRPADIRQ
ncbi:ankyrin repeat and LEM domain-containing protein 1 isoform X2 [Kryptolebias marmoratus]|nr:ankyrin repeat and LEM domain-containing protein 1 isoform X2 [Kryptolebias marmoratus]